MGYRALLVSLDSSRSNKELQLAAAEHVALQDVALADWLHVVTRRAIEGFNTLAAASRWLALPDSAAVYYLPQHGAFRVGKSEGALFLFGSMPESLATPYLTSVVRSDSGSQRELAVWLLVRQATPVARAFLKSVSLTSLSPDARRAVAEYLEPHDPVDPKRTPTLGRDDFMQAFRALHANDAGPFEALVTRVPDGEKDAALVLRPADLAEVRFARRYFVAAGTPEAVGYYMDFTSIIEAVMARADVK